MSRRKFDQDVNAVKRVIENAVRDIDWSKHGFKVRSNLSNRQWGLQLSNERHDVQVFLNVSGCENTSVNATTYIS